ncbi:pro-resilin-like [Thrips palmi]|uniref:Pro-resilin-like n=1 Tax=Thrips palmi TaxID=161013 RepID=A0A6P8Z814_THRPL|nr:pro-resilin-like [Thrips palmi]
MAHKQLSLVCVVVLAALVAPLQARPEPPSSYLPPARGGGFGGGGFGGGANRPSSSYGAPSSSYGAPSGGGGGYDDQSEPAKYDFMYEVDAPEFGTNFGHQESRDGDVAQGSYHVLLPDGRMQTVKYIADANGYRPQVSYQGGGGGYGAGGGGGFGGYPGGRGGGNGGYQY